MRSFIVRLVVLLSVLLVWACKGSNDSPPASSTASGKQAGQLISAHAPSTHYVRLMFSETPPESALEAARYAITDGAGATLPILFANRGDTHEIVLATEAQRETRYSLSFQPPGAAPPNGDPKATVARHASALIPSVVFQGSQVGEAYLKSAVAINNTQVVAMFSSRMGANAGDPLAYLIESPNLAVTSAAVSQDRVAVLLNTAPQEAIEYTLNAFGIEVSGQNKMLVDPTRATATFQGVPAHDAVAPRLLSAAATDKNTVILTFSEALSDDAADPKNFSIAPSVVITAAALNHWNTQVVLRTAPLLAGVEYTVSAGDAVKDKARIAIDPAADSATFSSPALSDGDEKPRVVGAISTSNTSVLVRYSRPMNAQAIDASHYSIVHENVRPEAAALLVTAARFVGVGDTTVELTTRSQNELTYRVRVSNVADKTGNPLAAPVTSNGVLVDPTSATFAGSPPLAIHPDAGPEAGTNTLVDADGDGITDNAEQSGWVVSVTLTSGVVATRQVTSNPDAVDTDLDLLLDRTELLQGSDPRSADTDGDGLSDNDEYNVLLSNPNAQDSDGDTIDDFLEVEAFKVNVLVADSDGDGIRDDAELFARGRDPRVADLPSHELRIGNVSLTLDERYTYTDDEGETRTETANTTTSLSTTNSSRHLETDGFRMWGEAGMDSCQIEKICPLWERIRFHAGLEGSTAVESESARQATDAYQRSLDKGQQLSKGHAVTRSVAGARVGIDFTLENTGDIAFSIGKLEITVQVQAPDDPGKLVPLATLVPERTLLTGEDVVINVGPRQSRGPIHMVNREVFPAVVEDLLRAPRGLVFKISNYDLKLEDDRNFAFGLQSVRERTVGVFVDPGDGNVKQYHAITAGVLNRARDALRCGPTGENPDASCTSDADCGSSAPCSGGSIIGGFSGYDGTGRNAGIPIDFVLQDVLQMPRSRTPVLVAGADGVANSRAQGDDTQIVTLGTDELAPGAAVVGPGRNLVLDTVPSGDDRDPTAYDGIKAGVNQQVDSIAAGDDVQLVPPGTRGVVEDTVIISAGENGVLDSALRGDDVRDVVTGYEVSSTCDANTPFAIVVGSDLTADTTAAAGSCSVVPAGSPYVVGDTCRSNADCGHGITPGAIGACRMDAQAATVGTRYTRTDRPVITSDSEGFLVTVPAKTDAYVAPGVPCTADADCKVNGGGAGRCLGPQKVVRVGARRDGEYRRFWALMLSNDVQYQTDFSLMRVRAGDVIGLQFIQDLDRDGLSSDVERLAGSSDFFVDTDGDDLFDFAEIRVGWMVGGVGQALRHVFSDPRLSDSDRDGLSDREESDTRRLQCACNATGPENLVSGSGGAACASNAECGTGTCRNVVACSASSALGGVACPVCPDDPTQNRTDPRRADTDGDLVQDADEVFGYLTGAGVVDVGNAPVILAGADLTANTRACPDNHCDGETTHCMRDGDCRNRRCVRPVVCDDVQVVPFGSGVQSARTVVVAPGPRGYVQGELVTEVEDGDEEYVPGAQTHLSDSRVVGDDSSVVGFGAYSGVSDARGFYACLDGSRFRESAVASLRNLPLRFPLCSVIKPGANGTIETQPGADDALVPGGRGQRLEWSDPLNPDSDMDFIQDGFERVLGSSPNDPGDTGQAGDRDRDGLSDNQETAGWTITYRTSNLSDSRTVHSNLNVPDTDLDGLPDYAERHLPCVGSVPPLPGTSECPSDPTSPDTDGDGLSDFDELSAELLARLAAYSRSFTGYALVASDSKAYGTDPVSADTDGDAVSDRDELFGSYNVLLPDGSSRSVTSNPKLADTDGDGLDDGAERPLTDARDADTDDDGRSDGPDSQDGFSPTVPDARVTVRVDRLDVNGIADTGEAELGFWILVRSNVLATNPTLIASARDASRTAFTHEHTEANGCEMIDIGQPQATVQLGKQLSFVLRTGQFFSIEGLIAEFDGESADCGDPPEYVPSQFKASGCYARFNKAINYSELSGTPRGEVVDFNPVEGGASGGDGCNWQLRTRMIVE